MSSHKTILMQLQYSLFLHSFIEPELPLQNLDRHIGTITISEQTTRGKPESGDYLSANLPSDIEERKVKCSCAASFIELSASLEVYLEINNLLNISALKARHEVYLLTSFLRYRLSSLPPPQTPIGVSFQHHQWK